MKQHRTRSDRKSHTVVWTQGPDGWQRVRARVPRSERSEKRSERVPRPPESRRHGAVAEGHAAGYSARELRDAAQNLVDPSRVRSLVRQLEDVAEAAARAASVPLQLAAKEPIVIVAAWFATRKKRKRKRRT